MGSEEHGIEVTIGNKLGLHARAAAAFVDTANRYQAEIFIEKSGERVNGKSIMGLMMLAAAKGTTLRLNARGVEAPAAVRALAGLGWGKFGEE